MLIVHVSALLFVVGQKHLFIDLLRGFHSAFDPHIMDGPFCLDPRAGRPMMSGTTTRVALVTGHPTRAACAPGKLKATPNWDRTFPGPMRHVSDLADANFVTSFKVPIDPRSEHACNSNEASARPSFIRVTSSFILLNILCLFLSGAGLCKVLSVLLMHLRAANREITRRRAPMNLPI